MRLHGLFKNAHPGVNANTYMQYNQGIVKGAKLCLNPYFFGWLEK